MLAILFYLLLFILLIFIIKTFGLLSGLLFIVILYFIALILSFIIIKRNSRFVQFFGTPGSGKTTIASAIVHRCNKKKRKVYSNVFISGANMFRISDIGQKEFKDCTLIIDESGLEFNNRSWKSNFTDESLDFFKKHRHYNVDIYLFSQCYSDSDKKLRDLTTELYLVRKSFYPFFIRSKEIGKRIGIDNITKQVIDEYRFKLFSGNYYFMPKYWKKFNTHER